MTAGVRTGLFIAAFFAAGGVTTAFLPIWLTDCGVSAAGVGQILGLGALAKLAAVPVWGAATDYVGRRRPMLFLSAAGAATLTIGFPFVHGFPGLLALVSLQGVAATALTPLADTLTLALAAARRLEYARTRAWGSASYMLATAAAGPVITALGTAAVPWLLAAGYGAAACFAPLLPEPDRAPHAVSRTKTAGLWRLRPFRLAVAASALIQGSHAAYNGFATIHWRNAGLSDTASGC